MHITLPPGSCPHNTYPRHFFTPDSAVPGDAAVAPPSIFGRLRCLSYYYGCSRGPIEIIDDFNGAVISSFARTRAFASISRAASMPKICHASRWRRQRCDLFDHLPFRPASAFHASLITPIKCPAYATRASCRCPRCRLHPTMLKCLTWIITPSDGRAAAPLTIVSAGYFDVRRICFSMPGCHDFSMILLMQVYTNYYLHSNATLLSADFEVDTRCWFLLCAMLSTAEFSFKAWKPRNTLKFLWFH